MTEEKKKKLGLAGVVLAAATLMGGTSGVGGAYATASAAERESDRRFDVIDAELLRLRQQWAQNARLLGKIEAAVDILLDREE